MDETSNQKKKGGEVVSIRFSPHALRKKAKCLAPPDQNIRVSTAAEIFFNEYLNTFTDEVVSVAITLVQNDKRVTIQEKDIRTAILLIGGKR